MVIVPFSYSVFVFRIGFPGPLNSPPCIAAHLFPILSVMKKTASLSAGYADRDA